MGLKSRIVDRGRQLVQSPRVMRWVSDDRVMRAAEGVMDARTRVRLAWHMLKNGHGLPHVDPALDDSLAETVEHHPHATNGNGKNGNGNGRAALPENGSTQNGSHAKSNGSNGFTSTSSGAGEAGLQTVSA